MLADFDWDVVSAAQEVVVWPDRWIHRIVETAEITEGRLHHRASLYLTLPARSRRRLERDSTHSLVPIAMIRRDRLIDVLDVRDASDNRLVTLSRDANTEFAQLLLESLCEQVLVARGFRASRDVAAVIDQISTLPTLPVEHVPAMVDSVFPDEERLGDLTRARRRLRRLSSSFDPTIG